MDLFDDENIQLNLTVKNLQDISKVFNEFTQSFTVPASRTNNQALSHWWNSQIGNNINPAVKQSGRIDLNGLPFKSGVFSLDKATVVDGKPQDYTITFYGNLTGLQDIFGTDTLPELELSAYTVDYNQYKNYLDGTSSGDNTMPLLSAVEPWVYDDPTTVTDTSFGIKYEAGADHEGGIKYIDMKPAIRLSRIIDAIEAKYNITFTSSLFASDDFNKLYMWAHGVEGRTSDYEKSYDKLVQTYIALITNIYTSSEFDFVYDGTDGDPDAFFFHNNQTDQSGAPSTIDYTVTVTPINTGTVALDEITYDVAAYDQANGVIEAEYIGVTGSSSLSFSINAPVGTGNTKEIIFAFRSNFPIDATWTNTVTDPSAGGYGLFQVDNIITSTPTQTTPDTFYFSNGSYTDSLTGQTVSVAGQLPKQRITEFLAGLMKMFNMVMIPTSSTTFQVDPWDTWQASGTTRVLDEYIDAKEYTVSPSIVFGEIDYKYTPTNTQLGKVYRESNDGIGYGDLETKIVDTNGDPISSETLKVELPFTNILFEDLIDQSTGVGTGVIVGRSLDNKLEPITEKPVLFYRAGTVSISSNPIGTRDRLYDNQNSVSTTTLCYQFNTANDSYTGSLNWGAEVNPYTGNSGGASDPSLYITYWSDYVTDLYDLQARRYSFKGVLPVSLLLQLNLNDKLQIGTNLYRVNAIRVNLTTGEGNLDLVNEIA